MMKQCVYCGEWHTSLEGCRIVPNNGLASQPLGDWRDAEIERLRGLLRQAVTEIEWEAADARYRSEPVREDRLRSLGREIYTALTTSDKPADQPDDGGAAPSPAGTLCLPGGNERGRPASTQPSEGAK